MHEAQDGETVQLSKYNEESDDHSRITFEYIEDGSASFRTYYGDVDEDYIFKADEKQLVELMWLLQRVVAKMRKGGE